MKKLQLALFVVMIALGITGCATLKKAASEVTPQQQAQMQSTLAPAAAAIPQPYSIPAAALLPVLGWVACVMTNATKDWWKKKTTPGTPTTAA